MLELHHVNKSYELEGGVRVPALKDVCLCAGTEFDAVRRGEFVMVRVACVLGVGPRHGLACRYAARAAAARRPC